MRRHTAAFACAAAIAFGAAASAQQPTPEVSVRTSVDRTALWVGDRVHYRIAITCRRGVDVLADDVSRDKLKVEGLEVVDSSSERSSTPDGGTTYVFDYVLTTYRIDAPALSIAPLRIRYAVRRAGQRLEDATPAGEVVAPGAAFAFSSVLPQAADGLDIRASKEPHQRRPLLAALQSIGVVLVVISIVPAAIAAAGWARRVAAPRRRRSARAVRHEERAAFEALRDMPIDTVERRRDAFTRLDALLRDHLRDVLGVTSAGLTPLDVPSALGRAANGTGELVADVLTACERARYGPVQAMPSADECRSAIDRVAQLLDA